MLHSFKYLSWPPGDSIGLDVWVDAEASVIRVSAARPVKGLCLAVADERIKLTDNCIDLVPGDKQRVAFSGGPLALADLSWRWLGDDRFPGA
jgi:beta-mannosidase